MVFDCEGNKSPGSDGLNMQFLNRCWEVVGCDVVTCFQEFRFTATLPKVMLSLFVALIPKSESPQGLDEHRLIFLIWHVYKFISKVLVARLRCVIDSLISKNQTTFISGRQLLYGVGVINELLDFAKRRKRSYLLFKVDFAKAYDCVDWKFLQKMMMAMNLGRKWMKWMDEGYSLVIYQYW